MKVAILGSGFITPEIFKNEVEKLIPNCEFAIGRLPWPGEPRNSNSEIQEYAGSPEFVIKVAKDADVLITDLAPVSEYVLDNLPNLKFVGVARGGPVNVNVEAATKKNIVVVNAPGRNGPAVAEYTVGLIINLIRHISVGELNLKTEKWQGNLYNYETAGIELAGRTVGLIGLGQVGKRVAKILKSFEMKILVYDPFVDKSIIKELGADSVELPELLKQSQVVSIHARLTPETRGILGANEFSLMQKGTFIINTARSPLLDYKALYDVLSSGFLGGAALDVYSSEPPEIGNPLFNLPNVLALPHIGGATQESAIRGAAMVANDIKRYFMDKVPPLHCKNSTVLNK